MADYQAVGAMVAPIKAPDTFGQLSSILGLQQQKQQLQQQAQTLQQQQLATQQQQGVSDFFGSWSPGDHVGADGTMDIESAHGSDAYKNLPGNARAAVDEKLIALKTGQLTNAKSLLDLNDNARSYVAQGLGGLDTDEDVIAGNDNGKAKVQAALKQVSDTGGAPAAKFALTYQGITNGDLKPGELPKRIGALQKSAVHADTQIQLRTPTPTPVQGEHGLNYVNTNPNAPQPVGSKIGQSVTDQGIPPGTQIVKDANENSYLLDTKTNTLKPLGKGRPAPATAGGGTGGFVQPAPDAKAVGDSIEQARSAGDLAGLNRHINDQLLALSKDTSTGYGTKAWQSAIGALSGGKFGADYQTIGGYLDRQAALAQRSMGLPETNAGLATAQGATATTEYSPQALQTKVKLADTLNTAAQQYRQGLDRTVGVGRNQDNSKYQAYRSAWAENFDPQVFAAENAIRRGDKEELAKIQQQEGPKGMAELARKTAALRALASGQLPQQ